MYIEAIAEGEMLLPQISWDRFSSGLKKSIDELIKSGLENVKVKTETNKQLCLEITSIKEYIVFLNAISRIEGDNKYPLSYHLTREIDGLEVPFPILCGSTFDYFLKNKELLQRPKFISFCRYPNRKDPSQDSIKNYKYDAKRELIDNFGLNDLDIILVVSKKGTEISEEMASLMSLLYFRNKGFMVTQYDEYHSQFVPGLPDQIYWRDPIVNELNERGLLSYGGTLAELTLCRFLGKQKSKTTQVYRTGVIEIKNSVAGNSPAVTALLSRKAEGYYRKNGCFDEGIAYAPFDRKNHLGVGIFSFDEEGIYFQECPTNYSEQKNKERFLAEMKEVIKQTLIMNFTLDEILELTGKQSSMFNVLKSLGEIEFEKIIDKVESIL